MFIFWLGVQYPLTTKWITKIKFASKIFPIFLTQVGGIFKYSDGFLMFVFFMLWMIASIAWCFAVSAFFTRARLGFIFGMVLWYLNYLPVQFLAYDETSR